MPAQRSARPVPTQDHQPSAAELAARPYAFEVDGVEYEVPTMSALKAGWIRKHRHLGDVDQAFAALEELATPEVLDVLDEMDVPVFNAFLAEWQKAGGTDTGKSDSSST